MELMAVDPKARVLAPRFIGGLVISMPILAVLFSAVGILGAYVVAVLLIGVDSGNFWSIMQTRVDVVHAMSAMAWSRPCVFGSLLHRGRAVPGL